MDQTIYKIRMFTLIGAVLLIGVVGYNLYSYANRVSRTADARAALQKQIIEEQAAPAKTVSNVAPDEEYSNPLDETNQYSNPFEEYQNPFDE